MIFIIDPFVANLLSLAINQLTPSVTNVTKNIGSLLEIIIIYKSSNILLK